MQYDVDKWDIEENSDLYKPLNKKNKRDVEMVDEYCKEHEVLYGNQTCKPIWERGTGNLDKYEVIVHPNKKSKLEFVEKRDGKTKKKKK